jgi:hypothetical protein
LDGATNATARRELAAAGRRRLGARRATGPVAPPGGWGARQRPQGPLPGLPLPQASPARRWGLAAVRAG